MGPPKNLSLSEVSALSSFIVIQKRCLFAIIGMNVTVKFGQDEEVIRHFSGSSDGERPAVAAVRVVRDAETNLGKGFAFVLFTSKAAAQMALAHNGGHSFYSQGKSARSVAQWCSL